MELDDVREGGAVGDRRLEAEPVREHWYERFLWAQRHGAIPAGRITSNAGAQEHKPATSTINCTVSGTIRDSMDDILGKVHEAGLTLIGYIAFLDPPKDSATPALKLSTTTSAVPASW